MQASGNLKKKEMQETIFLLLDNGSLKPASTLRLRAIAETVSTQSTRKVLPVSLLHSSKIDPAMLEGIPAQTLRQFFRKEIAKGNRHFTIIPLFFGKSAALTEYIPKLIQDTANKWGSFDCYLTEPLGITEGKINPDLLLAFKEIVYEKRNQTFQKIILTDHGTPAEVVNHVRRSFCSSLTNAMPELLINQACMECREGSQYDFNRPLLEDLLNEIGQNTLVPQSILILMMFFLPGRHAGENGDVAEIIKRASAKNRHLNIQISPLLGESPRLIETILKRIESNKYLKYA